MNSGKKVIAYQGEPGANSHIACKDVYPDWEPLPCATFEDAFAAIARDGAGLAEVHIRLQKALAVLGGLGDAEFRLAAQRQSREAMVRAEAALSFAPDIERVRRFVANWQ